MNSDIDRNLENPPAYLIHARATMPISLLPPTLSTKATAEILDQSIATVERYAADGLLPTLVRRGSGAPWRIVTVRLLVEHLGYSEDQAMAVVRFPLIEPAVFTHNPVKS